MESREIGNTLDNKVVSRERKGRVGQIKGWEENGGEARGGKGRERKGKEWKGREGKAREGTFEGTARTDADD